MISHSVFINGGRSQTIGSRRIHRIVVTAQSTCRNKSGQGIRIAALHSVVVDTRNKLDQTASGIERRAARTYAGKSCTVDIMPLPHFSNLGNGDRRCWSIKRSLDDLSPHVADHYGELALIYMLKNRDNTERTMGARAAGRAAPSMGACGIRPDNFPPCTGSEREAVELGACRGISAPIPTWTPISSWPAQAGHPRLC